MMKTFIDELADYLTNTYSNMLKVVVVFPNRRPALFLQQALGKLNSKPVFSPEVFSIKDFVYQHTSLSPLDNISLLFRLYSVYNRMNAHGSSYSFEHFIGSGELMLADFNDIDNYMVNPSDLFSNLDKAKAIELWNPGKSELTPMEENYLAFFQKLHVYYNEFVKELKFSRSAYDGLACRTLAEDILAGNVFAKQDYKYIFAGFNALNKAEKIILDHFVSHSGGCFFWDADKSYLEDEKQEAGLFLRSNLRQWQNKHPHVVGDHLLSAEKKITIIGAPLSLSQAKYTGQILYEMSRSEPETLNNTVLVPADEGTLTTLLESLPAGIENINVTMGYELKQSLIFQLIAAYIRIPVKSEKNILKSKELRIHYSDLLVFIKHPYFKYCAETTVSSPGNSIADRLLNSNRIFYTVSNLELLLNELRETEYLQLFKVLFDDLSDPEKIIERCLFLCEKIGNSLDQKDILQNSVVNAMNEVLLLLDKYMRQSGFDLNFQVFELLFQRLTANMKIPFEGEPLGGLQIMGYLETRCLDFPNVILTGFNEGFIPRGKSRMQTFIPFDLRKYYEMPLPAHDDAMYSYYFLRLIQRAKHIWILYNTEPDIFSGKEMSRFIRQIEYEYKLKAGKKWEVDHRILQVNVQPVQNLLQYEGAEKSPEILQIVRNRFEKGFSASALFNYVECPFRFYMNYVLKIEEPKTDIAESVEMHVLGTVVHETLKVLYEPAVNLRLDEQFFKTAKENFRSELDKLFRFLYEGGDMMSGKNLIIYEVACKMISNVLELDRSIALKKSLVPLMIEKDVQIQISENGQQYKLFGKFDRVDRLDNTIRISDYKTGKVDGLRLMKRGMIQEDLDFHEIDGKLFQLLFYMLLFRESDLNKHAKGFNLQSGIIPLKKANTSFLPLEFSEKEKEVPAEMMQQFKIIVFKIISEIMDACIPFRRTSDIKKCRFCVYQSVCSYFSPVINEDED